MKNLNKFFEDIYNLSRLKEEEATRFIHDAYLKFGNKPSATENELWNWAINRLNNEIQNHAISINGYLEGRTWKQFFEEFKNHLSNLIQEPNVRHFYRNLFWIYKRVLWGFNEIKDESLRNLKDADKAQDKAYQNTDVHGNYNHLKHSVHKTLTPWENTKKNNIRKKSN